MGWVDGTRNILRSPCVPTYSHALMHTAPQNNTNLSLDLRFVYSQSPCYFTCSPNGNGKCQWITLQRLHTDYQSTNDMDPLKLEIYSERQ